MTSTIFPFPPNGGEKKKKKKISSKNFNGEEIKILTRKQICKLINGELAVTSEWEISWAKAKINIYNNLNHFEFTKIIFFQVILNNFI